MPTLNELEVTALDPDVSVENKRHRVPQATQTYTFPRPITNDLIFEEAADHSSTPAAGFGYLWTKSNSPSSLIFTDDAGTDHNLSAPGLGSGDLLADGSVPLTANWDVGSFKITAQQFESDVTTGTAPLVVASTTVVANLNADQLDGNEATAFGLVADPLSQFAATTSAQLAGVMSDETGSGALVFATSPVLITPALGTPASGTLTNCTGYPIDISLDTSPTLGGTLAGAGYDVTGLGTLSMTEQASANADTAGDGQLWVKTATPNELWFTDDAGNDFAVLVFERRDIAFGDETTDIATGTAKATFHMPNYATTLLEVSVGVTTAPVGSTAVFDLNEGGTSVLSTKISIDASEKTSETAATPPVISDSALAANALMTVDIDQVGSSTAGAGPKIYLKYKRA